MGGPKIAHTGTSNCQKPACGWRNMCLRRELAKGLVKSPRGTVPVRGGSKTAKNGTSNCMHACLLKCGSCHTSGGFCCAQLLLGWLEISCALSETNGTNNC